MSTVRQRRPSRGGAARTARKPGWVRLAGWLLLLLGALMVVVWRQTYAISLERELRAAEYEAAVAEAERVRLVRRIEHLRSRARITSAARDRLGMHLPTDDEIVFLGVAPEPGGAATGGSR